MSVRLFLLGPTGCGKHDAAMAVAELAGLEIISVDSMKVYRGLDIGTAKPDRRARAKVPHHLVDILDPSERFTAGRFLSDADRAEHAIRARGARPLYSGGTFLYYKAFAYGLFRGADPSPRIREGLLKQAAEVGSAGLHRRLAGLDPASAARIHPNDLKRIVRALEVQHGSGRPMSEMQRQWPSGPRGDVRAVCLMRPLGELRARAAARMDRMLAEGLVEEVRGLQGRELNPEVARAIGYHEILRMLSGELSPEEAKERTIRRTWRFIRRQLAWARSLPELRVLDLSAAESPRETAERILEACRQG